MRKVINKYKDLTNSQLIERITELESVIDNMKEEKNQTELLNFPWVGNLGHWYWSVKSNEVLYNKQKIAALGFESSDLNEEIGYQFFTERIHPDDYESVMDNMRRHLSGEIPAYEVEYRICTKEGNYIWFYDRGKVTKRDSNGSPVMVAGIVFDITKNKELEMKLKESNKKLEKLVTIDELTGILNRRKIIENIKFELQRAKRTNSIFSLLMFDIDHFKKVNDKYGHNMGDLVLKSIASTVEKRIRETDIFGRWGGEEFIIVAPDTVVENAYILAEQLRQKISEMNISNVGKVTVSFGVTSYCSGDTVNTIVNRTDDMMYKAKDEGRNCVRYIESCE
jgi:diguanylate cyclase (GGDEF)-like protein/PAS domain S-box-containing protein